MPKLSAAALKNRIEQLQKQLAAAEASKGPAIAKVRALMKKLGVTLDDLTADSTSGRRSKGRQRADAVAGGEASSTKPRKARGKVAVKYRDGNGNTWTGRGKTPRWLIEAETSGANRESFKVN